jgi:hypothetical protein
MTTVQLNGTPRIVSRSESMHPKSISSLDPLIMENSISVSSKNRFPEFARNAAAKLT